VAVGPAPGEVRRPPAANPPPARSHGHRGTTLQ
jgi:hypothetical protein